MTVSAPAVRVEDLSFRYNSRKEAAIFDLNLEVQPGEVLLIAGASGCGKTTLLRCINGLIPRSYRGEKSGRVLLHGRDVAEMNLVEVSQIAGTLLQDPERQIVSSYVVGEIAFGPENLGLPRDEILQRVDEVIARLGIEHLRSRETFQLSGGEKQKVAIAGVLAMHPSILLLDEPLASLDPASADEALALVRRLADEGTTILLVEHRVEDALKVRPDRLMYLEGGRIRYLGPVQDVLAELDHRQVKLPALWIVQRVRQMEAAPLPVPETAVTDSAPRSGPHSGPHNKHAAPPNANSAQDQKEALISFRNVSFAYGDGPRVLNDINLDILPGDLVAILGPNGAGKSTLVKHAIGLLKPSEGQVVVGGRDTRRATVAQTARVVGYVFQSPTHMLFAPTVREELAFGPKNLRFPEAEIQESVRTAVQAVNLAGLEEFPPLGLSFGQQKRTAIAAVVAMRSRVLVMDEPTAGQDFANYTRFMEALVGSGSEDAGGTADGRKSVLTTHFGATLFITHDVDLAVTYANRVILLREGRIAADGPPATVLCDFDLLKSCRILPTSLLRLNCDLLPKTGRFLPAEVLGSYIETR